MAIASHIMEPPAQVRKSRRLSFTQLFSRKKPRSAHYLDLHTTVSSEDMKITTRMNGNRRDSLSPIDATHVDRQPFARKSHADVVSFTLSGKYDMHKPVSIIFAKISDLALTRSRCSSMRLTLQDPFHGREPTRSSSAC